MAEAAAQRAAIDEVNTRYHQQFRLFQGIEANIDSTGRLTAFWRGCRIHPLSVDRDPWQAVTGAFMPFKSQAQRRKFAQLLVEGKIANETFEEWSRETGGRKLPERVTVKRTAARTKVKSRRRRRTAKKR